MTERVDGLMHLDGPLEVYLAAHSAVLTVHLRQDSGCRSYAIEQAGRRWFVKQASTASGRAALDRAELIHDRVHHSALPCLRGKFDAADGLVHVYEWVPGEVLYDYVNYPGTDGRADPRSAHARFRSLPVSRILDALETIYNVHLVLADQGFVAVDFYDGGILYGFRAHRAWLCDLDEYLPGPFALAEDHLPGSMRFMAPEESRRGSAITQRTNVFTLARASAVLLSDGDIDSQAWRGGPQLREVIRRATARDPRERYPGVESFVSAWRAASEFVRST